MRRVGFGTYALMITVLFWGILLGGIVYSHMVYFPGYLSHLPESATVLNERFGMQDGLFWVTIHPVMIVSFIVSLIANWRIRGRRNLIAITFGMYVIAIIATSLYFVPELREFSNSPASSVTPAEWLERGQRWQHLSWIRGTLLFFAAFPLLFALATPGRTDADS